MIVNTNYRGQLAPGEVEKIQFSGDALNPPVQKVFKTYSPPIGTMIVFQSGKYRLMGVKEQPLPANIYDLMPFRPANMQLQSMTVVDHLNCDINLIRVARTLTCKRCIFEPELFPALRLLDYNPICVNVFATGKIVLLGVKDFNDCKRLLSRIKRLLLWADAY